jgi:hypothetical protein
VSQLILDDQIDVRVVVPSLQMWITAQVLHTLRPREHILDDRVPEILLGLSLPTFVTIDQHFCKARLCNPGYCFLYFALRDDQQDPLPALLRALFRRPEFRTRAVRMGKVVRVSAVSIDYWQFPERQMNHIAWQGVSRRRR